MKNNGKNPAMTDSVMSESPLLGRGRGEASGCGPQPIKNREAFFDYLEEGLQAYFDNHDRLFGGIIHLTVGVREGQVGGIIKSERMLSYSGFTLDRVRDIIAYVLPKHVPRTEVQLIADAIIEELRMGHDEPEQPKPKGRPKKQCKTTNTESHEQEET